MGKVLLQTFLPVILGSASEIIPERSHFFWNNAYITVLHKETGCFMEADIQILSMEARSNEFR